MICLVVEPVHFSFANIITSLSICISKIVSNKHGTNDSVWGIHIALKVKIDRIK